MPHLLILSGPGAGSRISLDRDTTSLGRDATCDIRLKLPDPERQKHISGKHAIITRDDLGNFAIEDGNGKGKRSKNKTFVNDVEVPFPERVPLKDNDVIQIFDFSFIFHDQPDSSVQLSIAHDSGSVFAQTAEKLKLIIEFGKRFSTTLELDTLLPQVVDSLLQHFKYADRALLVERDPATHGLVVRVEKTRADQETRSGFSDSIVKQCLDRVEGLLINDPQAQVGTASVIGLALESVLCAPLWSQDHKAFAVILLHTQNPKKKFTDDDLNFLMGVASQASIAAANARFHRDALARERQTHVQELERERLSRDLALAREVVRSFLPASVPKVPGYEFFACSESALEVGGDYFDFQPLKGNRLAILVGDVSGKGIAAALVMARLSAEMRACLRTEPDLASAIRQLNDLMQPLNLTDRFVTLAALVLDPATHTLTVVDAAHPPPLLLHGASGALDEAIPRDDIGTPIGVMEGYPYTAHQVTLERGDTVILFSDGISEAMDGDDQQLGIEGLYAILQHGSAAPAKLGARIIDGVKQHAAGCHQHDDLTLVCFGRVT